MFSLVGLSERTGSGLNMIVKVWKNKNWKEPMLKEVNGLEKTTLLLEMENYNPPMNPPISIPISLTDTQQRIIELLAQNNTIKINKIADVLHLKDNTIKKNIKHLKDIQILYREGTNRKGKWIVSLNNKE